MPQGDGVEEIMGSATISYCGRYRYDLTRKWGSGLPGVAFIGLNPSTADAVKDDPTIRRCIGFAKDWGFGRLVMLNLFAWRATSPTDLKKVEFPTGQERNNEVIRDHALACTQVICCWGAHGTYMDRDLYVVRMLRNIDLQCLGRTKNGHPRHPLYLRKDAERIPYGAIQEDA